MDLDWLISPSKVWSKAEVFFKPCSIPAKAGIYGWYFKEIPPLVPIDDCIIFQGLTLLYVGIAPREHTKNGKVNNRTLKDRISDHYSGNAFGSTLRKSLGCLLRDNLKICLQAMGNSKRLTFGDGEYVLSQWMIENAFVVIKEQEKPWEIEDEIISQVSLPLNLKGNELHPFYSKLSAIRKQCKEDARK